MTRAGRRRFLAGAGALLAASRRAFAQQSAKPVPRIAFLGAASAAGYAARIDAFRAGFRDLGYEEGRNIAIEYRWADGQYDRLSELAEELVRLKVDVIVTHSALPTLAAKRATAAIPIPVVMTNVGDAVAWGIVASLSRPGGNITGDTFFLTELAAKRLEVLKDTVPHVRRIAVLANPDNPGTGSNLKAMEVAAKTLQLVLQRFDARGPADLEGAFAAISAKRLDALAVIEDPKIIVNFRKIAELAATQRLPSVGAVEFTETGGLIGYGVNFLALYRRAAVFVDKILKGARPADIPVERPTRFELAISMNTAKLLGLKIPQSVLLRADRVIE
jgi:putative ABC transport system substrate-binding protein